jgi:hypothetical protein
VVRFTEALRIVRLSHGLRREFARLLSGVVGSANVRFMQLHCLGPTPKSDHQQRLSRLCSPPKPTNPASGTAPPF